MCSKLRELELRIKRIKILENSRIMMAKWNLLASKISWLLDYRGLLVLLVGLLKAKDRLQ